MPSQISPPLEYSDGDPINALAFNNHVKEATLQNGSITEQVPLSSSIVPAINKLDTLVVYDESEVTTNKLRQVKVQDLFTSDAPIVTDSINTSKINAKANQDVDITPNLGVLFTGKSYFSSDGFNVTVTSTAHELQNGMLIEFTNAQHTGHNGRYQITVLTADTFTYRNGLTVATAAGSGTLSYRKAATVSVIGSQIINNDLRVAGNTFIAGNTDIGGAVNVNSLKIGGKTPLTKEESFIGIDVKTITLPVGTAFGTADYATQAFNVPPGETWTFIWTAITDQYSSTGNTRPSVGYTWEIYVGNLTGSKVDSVGAGNQGYGGTSSISRSIIVRNEGTTGNNHTIQSPTVGMTYAGTMSLTWTAKPPVGWSKWEKGHINIILFKQKTITMAGQSGSGVPTVL